MRDRERNKILRRRSTGRRRVVLVVGVLCIVGLSVLYRSADPDTGREARNGGEDRATLLRALSEPEALSQPRAAARQEGGYSNSWQAVSAGVSLPSSGGTYSNTGSIGQPVVDSMSAGTYENRSGFWSFLPPSTPVGTQTPQATNTRTNTPATTPATSQPTHTPTNTAVTTPGFSATPTSTPTSNCDPPWALVSSPNRGHSSWLNDIEVISSNNMWAVGASQEAPGGLDRTLIQHWDGSNWTIVDSPNREPGSNVLNAAVAVAPNDVWAVGYHQPIGQGSLQQTLILHYDGTSWRIVDSPDRAGASNWLSDVTALDADEVWAVGGWSGGALSLRWDGSHWISELNNGTAALTGVEAISPTDIWAVGHRNVSGFPIIQHWDGYQWSEEFTSPLRGDLNAISGTAANDVWAVGEGFNYQCLALRWDGGQWTPISVPQNDYLSCNLKGIVAVATDHVWIHGTESYPPYSSNSLVWYWNGSVWNRNYHASSTNRGFFKGIAAVSAYNIWAAGSFRQQDSTVAQTLVERYYNPCYVPTPAPVPVTPTWHMKKYIRRAVYGAAVTGDGTDVYAAGGYSFQSGRVSSQFARYSVLSDTWTLLSPMPVPADSASAAHHDGKIYVFGGLDGAGETGTVLTSTRVYDISSGTWSPGSPMPGPRQLMGVGYHNGKIYLAGGYSGLDVSSAEAQTWEYDPVANTWATKTPMPKALAGPGYGVIDGHLYIAGGRDALNDVLKTLYAYNIADNTWSIRADLPAAMNAPGSAVSVNKLVLFGGGSPYFGPAELGTEPSAPDAPPAGRDTLVYDPATNSWSLEPPINVGRSFIGGASVSGGIVAVGGYNGSTSVDTVELRSHYGMPTSTPTPTALTTTPTETPAPVSTTIVNNTLYTIPDNGVVTSTITVPEARAARALSIITDLEVIGLTFNHASADNLDVTLISPAGTRVELFTDVCGATGWLTSTTGFSLSDAASALIGTTCPPMNGTYRPEGSLSVLLDEDPGGVWTLEVADDQVGNSGTLNGWGLRLTSCSECPTSTPTSTPTDTATNTPTATPTDIPTSTFTPTPVYSSCAGPINGSLTGAPTQTGRLGRDSVAASCGAPKTCPSILGAENIRYRPYIFRNDNENVVCVTINVTTGEECGTRLQSAAYAGFYDPADICGYYLGDSGGSNITMTYSVLLPALTNLVVVVNETAANACANTYQLTVTGISDACPQPSATATFTPTPTNTPICSSRAWSYQEPYPINIMDQAVATHGDKLYSFGGISNGRFVTNAYVYDPSANTWTAIDPLPAFRENAFAVSDGTYIYIMGGIDLVGAYQTTNYRYDPVADTYTSMAPLSLGVRASTASYLNGKIYRVGGIGAGNVFTRTASVYTVATDSWSPIANYPQPAAYLHSAVINGALYTAGGTDADADLASTYRYDAGANTWMDNDIAQLPAARWGGVSGVINGRWIIAGGFMGGAMSSDARAWSPFANTWLLVDANLQPRLRGNGGVVGDTFSYIGGSGPPFGFEGTRDNQRYAASCLDINMVGHVTWQGRPTQPDILQQLPLTLTLRMGNNIAEYANLTTDSSGLFTATVNTLPPGVYTWWVKGPQHLASSGTVTLTGAPTLSVEMGPQAAGDINSDNVVDISDFSMLRSAFGKSCGEAGYDRRADFTGDCVVDINDFSLLRSNFGRAGPPPPQSLGAQPTGDQSKGIPGPGSSAYLELRAKGQGGPGQADRHRIKVGESIVVELWVNPGQELHLVGQQSYINFTNSLLRASTPRGDARVFDVTLQAEVCNGPDACSIRGIKMPAGSIAFASAALANASTRTTAPFKVGEVTLTGAAAGEARLQWQLPSGGAGSTAIANERGALRINNKLFADLVITVVK